jgi:phage regulator Rha-like protein
MTGSESTPQSIERTIHHVRGRRVLLDADRVRLYGVETKNLNKAVRRNSGRFPEDFMLKLTKAESSALRFQSGTSNIRGGRRYQPYAFTQEGVAMLSSVLRSKRAIAVNIEFMRVFVQLRHQTLVHAEVVHRLATGGRLAEHERHIRMVLEAIRQLMQDQDQDAPASTIGFNMGDST